MAPLSPVRLLHARSTSLPAYSRIQTLSNVGLGALIGFVFLSLLLGALEKFRKNSPIDVSRKDGEIRTKSAEIRRLEREVTSKEETLEERAVELEAQRGIITDLRATYRDLEETNRLLEIRTQALAQENEELSAQSRDLTERNERLTTANAELRLEKNALERDLNNERRTVASLELNLVEWRRRLNAVYDDFAEVEAERERDNGTAAGTAGQPEGEAARNNLLIENLPEEDLHDSDRVAELRLQLNAQDRDLAAERRKVQQLEQNEAEWRRRANAMAEELAAEQFDEGMAREVIGQLQQQNESLEQLLQEQVRRSELLERRCGEFLRRIEFLTANILQPEE